LLALQWIALSDQTLPPYTTPTWVAPKNGWDVKTDNFPTAAQCQLHENSWLCDPKAMLSNEQCK